MDSGNEIHHAQHSLSAGFRDICGGEKGLLLRCHDDCKRPPITTCHELRQSHVGRIYVRSFLSIYLDGYENLVYETGHLFIFKGLPLHYMAPMTGGVSNREKHRFVFFPGFVKGFVTPWVPVYGIIGVLEEIRTFLIKQTV